MGTAITPLQFDESSVETLTIKFMDGTSPGLFEASEIDFQPHGVMAVNPAGILRRFFPWSNVQYIWQSIPSS